MNANATLPEGKGFPWIGVVVAIFGIWILIELFFPSISGPGIGRLQASARNDVDVVVLGLKYYVKEFDAPPAGDHAGIMTALRGENPKQIVFLDLDASRFNARGELLDPWKHPYRIDVSDPKAPAVYSFGKNGIDEGGAEGSDDVASWR